MTETMVFEHYPNDGDFAAMHRARDYLKARGFSVGAQQADAPTGVMHGEYLVSKWRRLSRRDIAELHGTMDAPGRTYRSGPVTVTIFDRSPVRLNSEPVAP